MSRRRPGQTRKKNQPRRYSDERIIAALQEKKGCVHLAADAIGCDPSTIYTRIKESEAVAECAEHENGKVDDVAEMVIYKSLLSDDPRLAFEAAKYRLNTKGRHRGYGEKLDVRAEGVTLEFIEEIVDVPPNSPQAEAPAQDPPA
jgi:hypothetical protein